MGNDIETLGLSDTLGYIVEPGQMRSNDIKMILTIICDDNCDERDDLSMYH